MYIGIDIGGTNIRVAGFTKRTKPEVPEIVRFPVRNNYQIDLQRLIEAIREVSKDQKIQGIGIGIAGVLDKNKSSLRVSPNLSNWITKPLKKDLEGEFSVPVFIENDALVSAIGEANFGLGKGKDFLFMVWGTGVGGAVVKQIDGKVYAFPSEPGHQIIMYKGELCLCGQRGCVEAYCGGGNLKRKYGDGLDAIPDKEWDIIFRNFARGVSNYVAANFSELVVLTGTVSQKQKKRVARLPALVSETLKIYPSPKVVVSELGDLGALYGALSLIVQ